MRDDDKMKMKQAVFSVETGRDRSALSLTIKSNGETHLVNIQERTGSKRMLVRNYELPQLFVGHISNDEDELDEMLDNLKEKCKQQIIKYASDLLDKNDANRKIAISSKIFPNKAVKTIESDQGVAFAPALINNV